MINDRAISVTQISMYIKNIFDSEELLENIDVFGEISDFNISRGIAYFSLKDENALLPCVAFDGNGLSSVKNGDMVVATGSPKYYVKGGRLSFNVRRLTPYGMGNLFEQFLRLKQTLENEGLFDVQHKKQINVNTIKRIGVVSSESGAVIQDIINITKRRNPNIDIVLYPVKVQGVNAELDICKGINFFSNYENVDVVIVARGGGSLEDLQPFNTEIVARAVYSSNKPIVSAVGHETDYTIIDFVSDLRAPTPSAAAELLTENITEQKYNLKDKLKRLVKCINQIIENQNLKINYDIKKLTMIAESFVNEINYALSLKQTKLNKLDPKEIMKLGYVKVSRGKEVIVSAKSTFVGDKLDLTFTDGKIEVVRRWKWNLKKEWKN